MGELQQLYYLPPPPLPTPTAPPTAAPPSSSCDDPPHEPPSSSADEPPLPPSPIFDPSRMIGIIRRKALIKDLAAVYHAECLTYCQELLELQKPLEEATLPSRRLQPYAEPKIREKPRKETMKPPKRLKKSR